MLLSSGKFKVINSLKVVNFNYFNAIVNYCKKQLLKLMSMW